MNASIFLLIFLLLYFCLSLPLAAVDGIVRAGKRSRINHRNISFIYKYYYHKLALVAIRWKIGWTTILEGIQCGKVS